MPGSQPGPGAQAVISGGRIAYIDPARSVALFGDLPQGSPGALMLQGPMAKVDPPQGSQVIQYMLDGSLVVDALPAGFQGADDAAVINTALLQAQGTGQASAAYLGGAQQGLVRLVANKTYNCQSTIVIPWGVSLWGGRQTVLAFSGGSSTGTSNTGAAIYAHGFALGNTVSPQIGGTQIRSLIIDGSAKPGVNMATGIDAGDQYELLIEDVGVQNFTNSATVTGAAGSNPLGDVGININNVNTLTEKFRIVRCTITNCTAGLQMVSTSGNSTSHMYGDIDVHFSQNINQHGLVIAHNGNLMNGWCRLRGNFWNNAGTANGAAVILLGQRAQAGHIQRMTFDVRVESDPTGSGSTQPTTIIFGTNADNQFLACLGTLVFLDGFQQANPAVGNFQLRGTITGDSSLSTITTPAVPGVSGTTVTNTQSDCQVTIIPNSGVTLTSVTVNGINTAVPAGGVTLFLPMNGTIQPFWTGAGGIGWVWYGLSAT